MNSSMECNQFSMLQVLDSIPVEFQEVLEELYGKGQSTFSETLAASSSYGSQYLVFGHILQHSNNAGIRSFSDAWISRSRNELEIMDKSFDDSPLSRHMYQCGCDAISGLNNRSKLGNLICEDLIALIAPHVEQELHSKFICSLEIVGSVASLLSLPDSSDLDMTLIIAHDSDDVSETEATSKSDIIRLISEAVNGRGFEVVEEVLNARVPVIKLTHVDSKTEVDISVGNNNAVRNTLLLRKYASLDSRVRALILTVKQWAKQRGVCDTRNSTLSSYSWALLVVHYLQVCKPPIIPYLDESKLQMEREEQLEVPAIDNCVEQPQNKSLALLLFGFFQYFGSISIGSYDWCNNSICFKSSGFLSSKCVRIANGTEDTVVLPTSDSQRRRVPWWRASVLDPVEEARDLGDVIARVGGQVHILNELNRRYLLLRKYFLDGSVDDPASLLSELCSKNLSVPSLPALCNICHCPGHMAFNCPDRGACTACGKLGHKATDCVEVICFRCKGPHRLKDCPRVVKTHNVKLLSRVLSWKMSDFCRVDLLSSELKQIPSQFTVADEWREYFVPFVFEELRAQLHAAAELDFKDMHVLQLEAVTDLPNKLRISFKIRNDEDVKVLEEMVFTLGLLVKNCSKSLSAASIGGLRHALIATGFHYQPIHSMEPLINVFDVETASNPFSGMEGANLSEWSCIPLNITTISYIRIYNALLEMRELQELTLMSEILRGKTNANRRIAPALGSFHLCHEFTRYLNDSQKAVVEAILSVGDEGISPVQLIKGPPGTGKTNTITALIHSLVVNGNRVHASAPTNVAVSELARRYITPITSLDKLRDVVLIGDIKRFDIHKGSDDPLLHILFDLRIELLETAIKTHQLMITKLLSFESPEDTHYSARYVEFIEAVRNLKLILDNLCCFCPSGLLSGLRKVQQPRVTAAFSVFSRVSEALFAAWMTKSTEEIWRPDILNMAESFRCVRPVLEGIRMKRFTQPGELKLHVLREARVIFSTVNVSARDIFKLVSIDVAIVDEATQMVQAETAIVLRNSLKCLILAGDEKQLPAMVHSKASTTYGYHESLFARLVRLEYAYSLLTIQYRMHPDISHWPRQKFYNGEVIDGSNVRSTAYNMDWHKTFPPLSVYDVAEGFEETNEHGSKSNELEANVVRRIVKQFRTIAANGAPISIGVISPYKNQVKLLEHLESNNPKNNYRVKVCTIDGFQGQECDVIILTTVRANNVREIGFLGDHRRLNVGITRAKLCLIIVCNVKTLEIDRTWSDLLRHCSSEGQICRADSSTIIKAISSDHRMIENQLSDIKAGVSIFENKPWEVIFSSEFTITMNKSDSVVRAKVIKIILKICEGAWPKYELNNVLVEESYRDIIHVFHVGDSLRLVWTVDVDHTTCKQKIKIWNIVLTKDTKTIIDLVSNSLKKYSDAYIARCSAKPPKNINNGHYLPSCWSPDSDFAWMKKPKSLKKDCVAASSFSELERCDVSRSVTLMKFHNLTSQAASMLISSENLSTMELPFVMSQREEHLVRLDASVNIIGRSGTGKTTVILQRMFCVQKLFASKVPPSSCRQILLTASPILCCAIKQSFDKLCHTCDPSTAHLKYEPSMDSDAALHPLSFQDCRPESFPLIITYSMFLSMLDKSLPVCFAENASLCDTSREVDFDRFASHYFPHFDESLKCDVNVVYTEIITHIKGSLEALHSNKGCMSEDQYVQLSNQRGSCISISQRRSIYKAFLKYEKLKHEKFVDYDSLDIVHYAYRCLSSEAAISIPLIDRLYVDEVQDLTLAQIALFRFICTNAKGFMFAGDTAQTIAHGVGFRFAAVKDVFYHELFSHMTRAEAKECSPKMIHLEENFRTHSGVVKLANSIVDLLIHFFPYSIDHMEPEVSHVEGSPPIFLSTSEDLVVNLFCDSKMCEFGAEQAILVRDDVTKQKVLEITKTRALVLTVLEAKGMEFRDCLVYNFFDSSPLKNDWRLLYDYFDKTQPHREFDPNKHSALCGELKLLYVLLTRAKQSLVICDQNTEFRYPILEFWRSKELVEVKPFGQDVVDLFLVVSSADEWKNRGATFFERKQYENALMCYQRAEDEYHQKLSLGALREQNAEKASARSIDEAKSLFLLAADVYRQLPGEAESIRVARCCERAESYHEAGSLYFKLGEIAKAAACFENGKFWSEACDAHVKANNCEGALKCCVRLKAYDKAVMVLLNFQKIGASSVDPSKFAKWIKEYSEKAALFHHEMKNTAKVVEFVNLFLTLGEKIRFYKNYSYFDELLKLLNDNGCFEECAEIYESRFDFIAASEVYVASEQFDRAAECLVRPVCLKHLTDNFVYSFFPVCDEDMKHLIHAKELLALDPRCSVNCAAMVEIQHLISGGEDIVTSLKEVDSSKSQKLTHIRVILLHEMHIRILQHNEHGDWRELVKVTTELHDCLKLAVSSLRSLMKFGSLQAVTRAQAGIIIECIKYFGLRLDTKDPLLAKHAILDTTCAVLEYAFKDKISQSSGRRASIRLSEFAEQAVLIFSALYHSSSLRCSKFVADARMQLLKTREEGYRSTFTRERIHMSLALYQLNNVSKQISDHSLSKTAKSNRTNSRQHALENMMDMILFSTHKEDIDAVLDARKCPEILDMIKEYSNDIAGKLDPDSVGKELLLCEFTNQWIDVTKSIINTLNKSNYRENLPLNLVQAFQWEMANENLSDPEWLRTVGTLNGSLLYAVNVSVNAMQHDLRSGAISEFVWGSKKQSASFVSFKTFTRFLEKNMILLLLYFKWGQNVIIPVTSAKDFLCRKNAAYASAIRELKGIKIIPASKWAGETLWTICDTMLWTLLNMNPRICKKWISERSNRPDSDEDMYYLTAQVILLIAVFLVNTSSHSSGRRQSRREQMLLRFSSLREIPIFSSSISQLIYQLSAKKTGNKDLTRILSAYLSNTGSPLCCLHCHHDCPDIPSFAAKVGIQRSIIEATDNDEISIVPQRAITASPVECTIGTEESNEVEDEPITLSKVGGAFVPCEASFIAPPMKEGYSDRVMANKPFLSNFFSMIRKIFSARTHVQATRKMTEQKLMDLNIPCDLWIVDFYLSCICPSVSRLFEIRQAVDSICQNESASMQTIHSARNLLDDIDDALAGTRIKPDSLEIMSRYIMCEDSDIDSCIQISRELKSHFLSLQEAFGQHVHKLQHQKTELLQ